MQATAAGKFNNIVPSISVPLMLLKNGLTLGTAILGGLFYTFSGKKEKDGSLSTCTRRKQTMASELHLSSSTVWRGMKPLKQDYVSEVEGKYDTYIFDHTVTQDGQFLRVPYELLQKEFKITYKERNNRPAWTITRRLTRSEAVVGGWIITQCDNVKKKKKELETSNSEIAEALNLSEPIVQFAIETLIGAHIIFRKGTGINRYQKSIYHVHRKFLRMKKRQKVAAPEEQRGDAKVVVHRNEADVRTEQRAAAEREYYNRRHLAEDIAERNYNRAMQDKQFKEADQAIREMDFDLAKAEVFNLPEAPEMRKRFEEYKRQRDDALKRLGMTYKDLRPQYEGEDE